ncbi:MAG: hypothetical protein KatS3mg108_0777 [Isosphaeraceae bacterium]|jgi:AraC family transcriptional regulator of adaptative response/methylated-DNA-[protein]-cysteine methyltransferase|nr:MAG: hypothetical protein KatS3mg108_0777 [Isosphaeraceae bacterium]
MVAGATGAGICLLQFWEPAPPELVVAAIGRSHAGPVCWGTNEHLEQLRRELELYFTVGCRFTVSLATAGTPFQERVWNSLRTIPYGATRSYEWVARTIGSPKAVRAVGLANGRNPVALVIPCHRVVNKDGGLGGYGGGVARKRWLLEWEASEARGPAATNA